jgi:Na+-transporting NADH:ubiquinone oxidoreductase subunit C
MSDQAAAPASNPDSIQRVVTVAVAICLVCAIFVSGSVVALRPLQAVNKNLDTQRNILVAAGLYHDGVDVGGLFAERIEVKLVDMHTGEIAEPSAAGITDVIAYDQRVASKDPDLSEAIPADKDIAQVKRRARYAKIYLIKDEQGGPPHIVLPISGYGLWSTLYGYLVLEGDLNTVVGITFTDHGETPGLGGEVDNPKWKAMWPGKQVYADDGSVAAGLQKGGVDPSNAFQQRHMVDALSGATLTGNGVNQMLQFWLGDDGFGPFLKRMKAERA